MMDAYKLLEEKLAMGRTEANSYFVFVNTPDNLKLRLRPHAHMEPTTYQALTKIVKEIGGSFDEVAKTWVLPNSAQPDAYTAPPDKASILTSLIAEALGLSEATVPLLLDIHPDKANYLFFITPKGELPAEYQQPLSNLTRQLGGNFIDKKWGWGVPATSISKPKHIPEEPSHGEATLDNDTDYSLATSKKTLGELVPILKAANGEIIDGFHRIGETGSWREETLPWIDTKKKIELARLAVNFARRRIAPAEMEQRVSYLMREEGMAAQEIAEQTGISERTIRKYMPQELKDQKKVAAGRSLKSYDFAEALQQTVKTPDTAPREADQLKEYVNKLIQCESCKLHVSPDSVKKVDGKLLCKNCRVKKAMDAEVNAALGLTPAPKPDSSPHEETTPPPPASTYCCPACGSVVTEDAYKTLTAKMQEKLQQLFEELTDLYETHWDSDEQFEEERRKLMQKWELAEP